MALCAVASAQHTCPNCGGDVVETYAAPQYVQPAPVVVYQQPQYVQYAEPAPQYVEAPQVVYSQPVASQPAGGGLYQLAKAHADRQAARGGGWFHSHTNPIGTREGVGVADTPEMAEAVCCHSGSPYQGSGPARPRLATAVSRSWNGRYYATIITTY